MCGLVAVVAKWQSGFSKPTMDAYHDLLFIDSLRGEDSTGMFLVEKDGDVSLAKEASHAVDFQKSKEYEDLMGVGYRNGRYIVGHNRKATKGNITDENAHPFAVDDKIVLVHNGTLWGDHKSLADTEVDSHAIAHVLANAPDDVQGAMNKIHGAYALIWYDVAKEQLNLLRNSQRPLCWVETENAWIFSSEPGMLAFVLNRHNITAKGKIEVLPEHNLATYKWTGKEMDVTNTKINPYVVPVTPSTAGSHWSSRLPIDDDDDHQFFRRHAPDGYLPSQGVFPIRKPVQQQRTTDFTPVTHPPATKAQMEEEKIARENGCVLNKRRMTEVAKQYTQGKDYTFTCKDTVYVNGKDDAQGSFIYGLLDEDPSMLVRVYLPATTNEYDILDWTLNQKKARFQFNRLEWKPYGKTVDNTFTGYGIVFGVGFVSPELVPQEGEQGFAAATIHLGENHD